MPTAVLIDGGFFVKRFRKIEPHNRYDAKRAAELAFRWALSHLKEGDKKRDLYRIFFYDCPPIAKRMHNPITKKCIDFSKSDEAVFRNDLHERLRQKRKVALRLGHLSDFVSWTCGDQCLDEILKGKKKIEDLDPDELYPNVRQKGVDMRIGIDISSLSLKKQVDQIVLIAGDSDFIPAAKLARREGIDFILDPMWSLVPAELSEHIDGKRTVCPKPKKPIAELQSARTPAATSSTPPTECA